MGDLADAIRLHKPSKSVDDSETVGANMVGMWRQCQSMAATFLTVQKLVKDQADADALAARKATAIQNAKDSTTLTAEEKQLITSIMQELLGS